MMKKYCFAALALIALVLSSCSGLTDEAKEMVGDYYITEISPDVPQMELKGNGKCIVHAMREGLIHYTVPGKWNVKNDSLIITLKPEKLEFEGDSTLIGDVPKHISKRVVDFNGSRLTLQVDGMNYVYDRRGHMD